MRLESLKVKERDCLEGLTSHEWLLIVHREKEREREKGLVFLKFGESREFIFG